MLLEGRSRNINSRRRKPEWINIRICPTAHVLISDNSPARKIISILTLYIMRMQGYCDVYKWTILKRTSPEVKNVYIRRHQGAKCARRALVMWFITNFHTAPLSTRSVGKTLEFTVKSTDNITVYFQGCSNDVFRLTFTFLRQAQICFLGLFLLENSRT